MFLVYLQIHIDCGLPVGNLHIGCELHVGNYFTYMVIGWSYVVGQSGVGEHDRPWR